LGTIGNGFNQSRVHSSPSSPHAPHRRRAAFLRKVSPVCPQACPLRNAELIAVKVSRLLGDGDEEVLRS